ncbi:MarR family transcriptional regulator [Paenarthrobacter sp. DKR-5]|uniref:MarR family winged helix-turn-helix transcriptional regulator n=1 Tax=Paenarthrobacter sp. DKR-5 TaxID=2835535 RepID=UPI001BDC32B3|nr:MarR family transcriptional regulator [Paenarthrobacter sp. DKR-5]MBT1001170.1 MarR family transcriptional regulator [Paenarthrobacter sp. DKR-5]
MEPVQGASQKELVALAAKYRESLRHAVYLTRSLDAEGDLTTAQVSTLNMLAEAPLRIGGIARRSGIKVPSATEQVIRLEAAGLVLRRPDPDDARGVLVQLTERGAQELAAANQRRNAILAERLAALSPDDRTVLEAAVPVIDRLNSLIPEMTKPEKK